MKAFFAAIIVLIFLAFAFTNLPGDLAKNMQNLAVADGSIKDRITGAVTKTLFGGKNTAETRLELIEKIEESLGALQNELEDGRQKNKTPEQNKAGTKTPLELTAETTDLLEELKSHNADEGFLKNTADKIISKVLPSSNMCPSVNP
ncbi:MAG: hypothetical protein Q7R91_00125 [bacterium]|nr:hypothetical protein [bacterium]